MRTNIQLFAVEGFLLPWQLAIGYLDRNYILNFLQSYDLVDSGLVIHKELLLFAFELVAAKSQVSGLLIAVGSMKLQNSI
jgi:hypothetical protein